MRYNTSDSQNDSQDESSGANWVGNVGDSQDESSGANRVKGKFPGFSNECGGGGGLVWGWGLGGGGGGVGVGLVKGKKGKKGNFPFAKNAPELS